MKKMIVSGWEEERERKSVKTHDRRKNNDDDKSMVQIHDEQRSIQMTILYVCMYVCLWFVIASLLLLLLLFLCFLRWVGADLEFDFVVVC